MMTLLAPTRLMPREPARVEIRNKRPLGEKAWEMCRVSAFKCIMEQFQNQSNVKCLPWVIDVIKLFSPLLPGQGVGGAIQAIVVDVPEPLAFTFTDN